MPNSGWHSEVTLETETAMLEKLSSKSLFSRTFKFIANDWSMQMRFLNLKLPTLCFVEEFGRTYRKVSFCGETSIASSTRQRVEDNL